MDAKHTPGPWLAAAGPSSIVGWPVVSGSGGLICRLAWFERAVPAGEMKAAKGETLANALLIAAAPDLLAALEVVRDMLVEVVTYADTPDAENDPVWRDLHARGADCLHTAGAAIAKATGG